jgi:hypothetical protein
MTIHTLRTLGYPVPMHVNKGRSDSPQSVSREGPRKAFFGAGYFQRGVPRVSSCWASSCLPRSRRRSRRPWVRILRPAAPASTRPSLSLRPTEAVTRHRGYPPVVVPYPGLKRTSSRVEARRSNGCSRAGGDRLGDARACGARPGIRGVRWNKLACGWGVNDFRVSGRFRLGRVEPYVAIEFRQWDRNADRA